MGFWENLQASRDQIDLDEYRAELKDMGASDKDADASVEYVRSQQTGGQR